MKTGAAAGDGNQAPSVSLSLKARETASLSLKRIFEQQLQQQRSSSDDTTCSPGQYINVEDVIDVHLVDEMPMAAPAEPDLDLKLATPTPTAISSYTKSNDSTSTSRHADERKVDGGGSGQLTIFYAGTMCVYEDVSIDKAKAIILLASGNGDVYRSTYANSIAARIRIRTASPPPARTPETAAAPATRSAKPLISRSQAELPFARKASLARFLEKRKERVEEKVANANKHATFATIPPQKKLCSSFLSSTKPS